MELILEGATAQKHQGQEEKRKGSRRGGKLRSKCMRTIACATPQGPLSVWSGVLSPNHHIASELLWKTDADKTENSCANGNCLLTNWQAGGGRVSGAALATGDTAASGFVPAGPRQHPVGPWVHGAQGRTRQHTTRRATATASFRETRTKH